MRPAARMNSCADDLPCTTKELASDACPVNAPREMYLALDVGQAVFFMSRIFKTILLPDLTDGDSGQWSTSSIQSRDHPVWGYCPRRGMKAIVTITAAKMAIVVPTLMLVLPFSLTELK